MTKPVRVRFAPSPTGGLHLGGVRTVLYNYLFANKHGGSFILRIEDTDQTRFVEGAEQYIFDCLKWCGPEPDESAQKPGAFGPYRQSERKERYHQFAHQLVGDGFAYYAFDTPLELEAMREKYKSSANPSPTYNQAVRNSMKNSLGMNLQEAREKIAEGMPYVVRVKMPEDEVITFTDLIRGEVSFNSSEVDDKVLLKADGMPTYHLAVVVDDYLMNITHAFRGEEWLSSAPVHLYLWEKLGWKNVMPQWAHLPLIMGPDGAKLSKRHGNKYGFPIFAMSWHDAAKDELTEGFKERGFLPQAFVNYLALLGWNDGNGQEMFTLDELIEKFDLNRVHSAGAQFDFDKAKWFNHEWIKKSTAQQLLPHVTAVLQNADIADLDEARLLRIIDMVKERCTLLTDFEQQSGYFFRAPSQTDFSSVKEKWSEAKTQLFTELVRAIELMPVFNSINAEQELKELAAAHQLKPGELMLPLRLMLVGGKFGPGVFDIAELLGAGETAQRIRDGLAALQG